MKYEELLETVGIDGKVSCSQLASAAHVSKSTASRIIRKYHDNDGKISLLSLTGKNTPRGVGIKSLTAGDEMILLLTYYSNPKTTLKTYQITLYQQSGTYVSRSLLSKWFYTRFPHKMILCKTNKVAIDKFKQENTLCIHEYNLTILLFFGQPWRFKFGDKKALKGRNFCNGKAQKDPFTGIVPSTLVQSDFRNTYSIIGFCGVDLSVSPMAFYLTGAGEKTSAALFMDIIQTSVQKGFLHPGDILILDNVAIHTGQEAEYLLNYLTTYGILLTYLGSQA
ncbi:hypothetical protein ACA910_000095 [Epithemia clementina (nom. ined.)]